MTEMQSYGWCDIDDLFAKTELPKAAGLEVMICIHYSDHWANPSKQTKPAAWTNLIFNPEFSPTFIN